MAGKRFDYRTLVEERGAGYGYVYSKGGETRLGFSSIKAALRGEPLPSYVGEDALAVWQTNWGTPSKENIRVMFHALQLYFPDRQITCV